MGMSVDDYIPKGSKTQECPISSDATGNMVVKSLYKNPIVAWREAVSNACDAMRHCDEKTVKVYSDQGGDGIVEDWGTGIEDDDHFRRFIGIGRIRDDKDTDVNIQDDKEIGRFGVGKNSYLGLSKIKLVQFFSHSNKDGKKRGMIVTLLQIPSGKIKYVDPPEYLDSADVLTHRGMKVVIRQLAKPMTKNKLMEYLSKRFALKIARGYKIYVDNTIVPKPESFDSTHQSVLFKLDNGAQVYGNLTNVDKPKNGNIDILVNQVFIESKDFEWKVEGWVNCDELELTASRDDISTDEATIYKEFSNKFRNYLLNNFDPIDTEQLESKHEKDWEDIASQAIINYFKLYADDTCNFMGEFVSKLGLKGASLKGKEIWKKLDNSSLKKLENPDTGGDIEVKNVTNKKVKKKRKRKKFTGTGKENIESKYEIIPGKGLVAIKNDGDEEDEPEEITPEVRFLQLPKSKEMPLVYFDEAESAFILNTSWDNSIKMFNNPKSDGARNEILRAIVKATPENKYLPSEDLDKKYYTLINSMSGK
jgi:hypothetical protein